MDVSATGLVGAAIGFYIGWIDYRLALGALRGWTARHNKGASTPIAAWMHRNSVPLERVLLVLIMLGIPAIGYWAGASFAS